MTLFLLNVGFVNSKLGGTTKRGVGHILTVYANGQFSTVTTKANIAVTVRSSSTAAIVAVNFIGTNLVALARTVKIVFNTGVKAAIATRVVTFGIS